MKLFIITFFFICVATQCLAAIYMKKDANGNITYTDVPFKDGMKIDVPNVNTSTSTQPTSSEVTSTIIETRPNYTIFLITSPRDQETIQNQITVPVEVKLEPELRPGNKILLLLDNKPWGNPVSSTHLETGQIDRGTHQISAIIIDENQRILKQSNTVTIYFHRTTLNSPARITGDKTPPLNFLQSPPASAKTFPIQTSSFLEALRRLLG